MAVAAMRSVMRSGHVSGGGKFTAKCEDFFKKCLGVRKAYLVASGTQALEMAALLLDIKAGDEVIVPSFSFPSTVNAFLLRGARPVFADIRIDTLNLNERLLPRLITPRTRAIVVVHYAGIACEMNEILRIAKAHGLPVIEDNAHGLFGRYCGRYLGTIGTFGIQSFHETKNFTCGEGGALFVNDARYIARAEIVREKGTNRRQFVNGEVDKYRWMDVGSSFLLSDVLAAFLWTQIQSRGSVQGKRRKIWLRYAEKLRSWSVRKGVVLPFVPDSCEQAYHLFYLLMPSERAREKAIKFLRRKGISATFHFLPLHASPMGWKMGGIAADCPRTTDAASRILRLPLYPDLSNGEQDRIIRSLLKFDPSA